MQDVICRFSPSACIALYLLLRKRTVIRVYRVPSLSHLFPVWLPGALLTGVICADGGAGGRRPDRGGEHRPGRQRRGRSVPPRQPHSEYCREVTGGSNQPSTRHFPGCDGRLSEVRTDWPTRLVSERWGSNKKTPMTGRRSVSWSAAERILRARHLAPARQLPEL